MAPRTFLTTLVTLLCVSTSVIAQSGTGTGTGTGLPIASLTVGAPYPITNATLSFFPGSSCPEPTTITTTTQFTSTITVPASSAVPPTTAPYPIPGSSGLPVGTGTGTGIGTGTGTGTGFAVPTGFAKRMEMRGLKRGRKEKKRAAAGWW